MHLPIIYAHKRQENFWSGQSGRIPSSPLSFPPPIIKQGGDGGGRKTQRWRGRGIRGNTQEWDYMEGRGSSRRLNYLPCVQISRFPSPPPFAGYGFLPYYYYPHVSTKPPGSCFISLLFFVANPGFRLLLVGHSKKSK